MFKIISRRDLAPRITEMRVEAPRVAAAAMPGQFVIVRVDEEGERIPLTICDYDREAGWVTIVTQTVGISSGSSTRSLGQPSGPVKSRNESPSSRALILPDEIPTVWVTIVTHPASRS